MATGFRNLIVYIPKDIFDDWRRQGMKKDFASSVATKQSVNYIRNAK